MQALVFFLGDRRSDGDRLEASLLHESRLPALLVLVDRERHDAARCTPEVIADQVDSHGSLRGVGVRARVHGADVSRVHRIPVLLIVARAVAVAALGLNLSLLFVGLLVRVAPEVLAAEQADLEADAVHLERQRWPRVHPAPARRVQLLGLVDPVRFALEPEVVVPDFEPMEPLRSDRCVHHLLVLGVQAYGARRVRVPIARLVKVVCDLRARERPPVVGLLGIQDGALLHGERRFALCEGVVVDRQAQVVFAFERDLHFLRLLGWGQLQRDLRRESGQDAERVRARLHAEPALRQLDHGVGHQRVVEDVLVQGRLVVLREQLDAHLEGIDGRHPQEPVALQVGD
mmetsp:Transcript_12135/g.24515  ORF Transcript_12135/g.24515 Transcript_12135/m.24515 type:complete len:345 (+) Transcript_12135:1922-2956(+)